MKFYKTSKFNFKEKKIKTRVLRDLPETKG